MSLSRVVCDILINKLNYKYSLLLLSWNKKKNFKLQNRKVTNVKTPFKNLSWWERKSSNHGLSQAKTLDIHKIMCKFWQTKPLQKHL